MPANLSRRAEARCYLLTAALVLAALPGAAWGYCTSDQQCAPWAECTTSLGECGDESAPYDVCTGTCVAGRSWRLVARGSGSLLAGAPGAGAALEAVPPVLGGHLAASAEGWTQGLWRVGGVLTWPVLDGLVAGVRADAAYAGGWGAAGAARIEWFPWWPFSGLTPAHYFALCAEGGVLFTRGERRPFASLGLAVWPPAL